MQCRHYVERMDNCNFQTFSQLFEYHNSIHIIKLNKDCWQNSQCSCNGWQKNYVCCHIPFVASKEPLCDFTFKDIILKMPLEKKKKRGRKENTKPALLHQPHGETYKLKEIQVDENDDQIKTPSPPPSKRGRKQLSTKQLQVPQSIDKRETRSSKKL